MHKNKDPLTMTDGLLRKFGLGQDATAPEPSQHNLSDESSARLIAEDGGAALTIIAQFGSTGSLYPEVLLARTYEGSHEPRFAFDAYSTHYVLFHKSEPIGSLTMTRHRDGPIDCSEYYPSVVMEQYGEVLASICKFRIHPGPHSGMKTFRTMVRAVWRDLLKQGVKIDIINIEKSNLAAFRRIGYVAIDGSAFIHPKLGTDSIAMVLSADPTHRSFFSDLFESEVDTPVPMTDLLRAVKGSRDLSRVALGTPQMAPPRPEQSRSKTDQWTGYGDYQRDSRSVSEYYETVNHCLSMALHESLSRRCELALDIACGAGTSTRIISRFADRVIGVDSSLELIREAKAQELGDRFEFVESRFEDSRWKDGTFDLVSASWYVNHLHNAADLNAFIARAASLLKPGGHIALVVPAASYASETTQTIARKHFNWHQATLETQPDYARVIFSYGEKWIVSTNWQPLKLMRLLDEHFYIRSWDVKETLTRERRLTMIDAEPPFEIIYGKLRCKGGKK